MLAMSYIAFFAACVIVALQSLVLRTLFRDTVSLQSVFESQLKPAAKYAGSARKTYGLNIGASVPDFSVEALDHQRPVVRDTLLGKSSVMLFLDLKGDGAEMTRVGIASIINYLAAKADDEIYVVCNDSKEVCAEFKQRQELDRMYGDRAVVCIDMDEKLTSSFRAFSRPCAIIVDEHGIVQKVGGLHQQDSTNTQSAALAHPTTPPETSYFSAS